MIKKLIIILIISAWLFGCTNINEDLLTPRKYTQSLSANRHWAELELKTIYRNSRLHYQLKINWFDNLRKWSRGRSILLTLIDDKNFKVASDIIDINTLIEISTDDMPFFYKDGALDISIDEYNIITWIKLYSNLLKTQTND